MSETASVAASNSHQLPLAYVVFSLVAVAAIWGVTNPFLRSGAATTPAGNVNEKGVYGFVMRIVRTLLNWRFSVPFLVNQTGSMVYNFLLGNADISMASPICNSLTFVFTGITARALGEKQPITWQTVVGTALILAGVATCVASKL